MHDVLNVVVDGIWRQGEKNRLVRLVTADSQPLPAWQPGAHIDVHLPGGLIRQYSLTGDCGLAAEYLICVAADRASRGGSRYIHDQLRPGQTLSISAPRNLFPLLPARHVTLLAAGIGITPLYAMALQLASAGQPFRLHYFVGAQADVAFRPAFSTLGDGACVLHVSAQGESPRHHLAQVIPAAQADSRLYSCGPTGFMATAAAIAAEKGWPATHIHSEAFQPVHAPTAASDGATFTITIRSTGEQWPVPPDKTIAQVLLAQGVSVPLSCEMGLCGACLTPVLEGVVDHRDTVQSAVEKTAARQQIALCCSRSRSSNGVIEL